MQDASVVIHPETWVPENSTVEMTLRSDRRRVRCNLEYGLMIVVKGVARSGFVHGRYNYAVNVYWTLGEQTSYTPPSARGGQYHITPYYMERRRDYEKRTEDLLPYEKGW